MLFLLDDISGTTLTILRIVGSLLLYIVIFVLPLAALAALLHVLLSVPLRRRERARFFLDLLETALAGGRPVEPTLAAMAESRDRSMGVRFHLLAAHLGNGRRLGDALEEVPRLLPPQISAILRVGEKLGDLRRVLPACREVLNAGTGGMQSAMHYLLVLVLVFSPVAVFLMTLMTLKIAPSFRMMFQGMTDAPPPAFPNFILSHMSWLVGVQAAITLALLVAALVYIGGPRLTGWLQSGLVPFVDRIAWFIPWKRRRLQRAFSATLAVLLDVGVPEAEAVRLAGDCTANQVCRWRAQRVIASLEQGVKLNEAVRAFDGSGEFQWRLANACHAREGFQRALAGWHETLDAKAFQQEEAAAHAITSGLVVLNGLLVALVATAAFGLLIAIMEHATIW
jgi:type II secretory pathway component PulF